MRSAGVARQYTGTSGKVDNCQIGVFLAYASARGRALVDRELYLPESWTEDRDRCTRAGVPDEVGFATKPQLGVAMLARVDAAGALSGWVTADEAYGQNPTFRAWLVAHQVPFVLATATKTCWSARTGTAARPRCWPPSPAPPRAAGNGAASAQARTASGSTTGPRSPSTRGPARRLGALAAGPPPGRTGPGKKSRDLAFYRCAGPAATPLRELIRVAGARWAIEECFQAAKNEAGLDQYQVRDYRAWYAHITLALAAAAYLAAIRTTANEDEFGEKGDLQPAVTA